jgi:hypothetical protein
MDGVLEGRWVGVWLGADELGDRVGWLEGAVVLGLREGLDVCGADDG